MGTMVHLHEKLVPKSDRLLGGRMGEAPVGMLCFLCAVFSVIGQSITRISSGLGGLVPPLTGFMIYLLVV